MEKWGGEIFLGGKISGAKFYYGEGHGIIMGRTLPPKPPLPLGSRLQKLQFHHFFPQIPVEAAGTLLLPWGGFNPAGGSLDCAVRGREKTPNSAQEKHQNAK